MGANQFRTALFGYNKQDVHQFIESYIQKAGFDTKDKDEQISRLNNLIEELESKNFKLEKRAKKYDEEREHIIETLLNAEKNAKNIMDQAQNKAISELYEIEEKVQAEKSKLREIRKEIIDLRHGVIANLKKFEDDLAALVEQDNLEGGC